MNRLAAISFVLLWTCAQADEVKFIAFGDMPYDAPKSKKGPAKNDSALVEQVFPGLVDKSDNGHRFVAHYGDLKTGKSKCTSKLIDKNLKLITDVFPGKTLYTPGDNDWTDCDRAGDSELAKLQELRGKLNVADPDRDFIQNYGYSRQKGLPENQAWTIEKIEFAMVHITGTNNGRSQIKEDDKQTAWQASEARDELNNQWNRRYFSQGLEQPLPGGGVYLSRRHHETDYTGKILGEHSMHTTKSQKM